MSRVRVVIATTSGPIEVRRITPEHSDVHSAVCIEHADSELPISAAYNAFVRPPTGIIQKQFGHDAFLLELSGRIDVGDSWKLGVFAAHGLHYADRLAVGADDAELVIWTTGEVMRDLRVSSTGYIDEKLRRSQELFEALARSETPLRLYVPADNAAKLDTALLAELGVAPEAVVAVASAGDVLDDLGLPAPGTAKAIRGRPRRPWLAFALAGGGAVAVATAALVITLAPWRDRGETLPAWARAQPTMEQLREILSPIDIAGTSTVTGGPFVMKLRSGGRATVEVRTTDLQVRLREAGKWWGENGGYCFRFPHFSGGRTRCPKITIENGRISAWRGDGSRLSWTFKRVVVAEASSPESTRPEDRDGADPRPSSPPAGSDEKNPLMAAFRSNLSPERISALLSERSVVGTAVIAGTRFAMALARDGEANVEMNIPDSTAILHDQGRWWVDGGKFCYKFSRFGKGRPLCRHIFDEKGNVRFMLLNGRVLDWRIEPAASGQSATQLPSSESSSPPAP